MVNCINYSTDATAKIILSKDSENIELSFENPGPIIKEDEKQFLFQHFFRGENSHGKRGFGLGLVFVHKIVLLHGGAVHYESRGNNLNLFTIAIPLR